MQLKQGIYNISKNLELLKFDNYKKKFCLFLNNNKPDFKVISLPKGNYRILKGNLSTVKNINKNPHTTEAIKEIINDLFRGFKIVYGKNKRKCSLLIVGKKKILLFDKIFLKNINELQRKFVMFHELGHVYVKDNEFEADNFSLNVLLSLGFDPKMIIYQIKKTLKDSDFNYKRINNLEKNGTNTQKN